MHAHYSYAEDPHNLDRHDYLREAIEQEAMALLIARDFAPQYEEFLRDTARELQTEELLEKFIVNTELGDDWELEPLLGGIDRTRRGRPFNDGGPNREQRWSVFGTNWTVVCANLRPEVLAAERLISAIQIVQVELAADYPEWVPDNIHIDVTVDSDGQCERVLGADTRWVVHLAPASELPEEDFFSDLLSTVTVILMSASLLPDEEFMRLVETAFGRGLGHKLSGGRPYDEAADILNDAEVAVIAALPEGPLGAEYLRNAPVVHQELRRNRQLSVRYDREEALAAIARRYDRLPPIAQHTIPRLASDPVVGPVIQELRDEGWLDWQLLTAITNIVGNARQEWEGIALRVGSPRAHFERANTLLRRSELPEDPDVPAEVFTKEYLIEKLEFAAVLALGSYGLRHGLAGVEPSVVVEVLRERFNFGVDDVPHDDFWGSDGTVAQLPIDTTL